MQTVTQLQGLYEDYHQQVKKVRRAARAFDGIFGLGNDPRNDPCHEAFYRSVGTWVEELIAAGPDQAQLMEAAVWIVEGPSAYKDQESYWYMFVCHGYLKPLIPLLSSENCRILQARFEEMYPKRERMPLQKEILKLLSRAGK